MSRISFAAFLLLAVLAGIACGSGSEPTSTETTSGVNGTSDPPVFGAGLGEYTDVVRSSTDWGMPNELDSMVRESQWIVVGTVSGVAKVDVHEVPAGAEPCTAEPGKECPTNSVVLGASTTFDFAVSRVVKGATNPTSVQIGQRAGVIDGTLYVLSDDVPLVPGQRYLLFLVPRTTDSAVFETKGFVGGQYPIRSDHVEAAFPSSNVASALAGRSEQEAVSMLSTRAATLQ